MHTESDQTKLHCFSKAIRHAETKEKQDILWQNIASPLIEDVPAQPDIKRVTFLYRFSPKDLEGNIKVYLLSNINEYPLTEQNKFIRISQTDIGYLTLVLPSHLRCAYNIVKLDETSKLKPTSEEGLIFPRPTGRMAEFNNRLNYLFEHNQVEIDLHNKKKEVIYYKDIDNPDEIYGKQSILELPQAPYLSFLPNSFEETKAARDRLKEMKRLTHSILSFSKTSLKEAPGYYETPEQSQRSYWVYLPPDYNKDRTQPYPVFLFLDGSSYLDVIPAHCILEQLYEEHSIPPCIAIFLDSPDGIQRMIEYHCNVPFAEFLVNELLETVRTAHQLNMTNAPESTTIVGLSFSGLAAWFIGLTHPHMFGQVIAQSPSLEAIRAGDLDRMIASNAHSNPKTHFILEAGTFETIPCDLEFEDGAIQSLSSFQALENAHDLMKRKNYHISRHAFIGGHDYVCWRVSLYDRIKELFQRTTWS